MKRFVALLNDGSFFNTYADRMELNENTLYVYWENDLVGLVDIAVLLSARLDIVQEDKY